MGKCILKQTKNAEVDMTINQKVNGIYCNLSQLLLSIRISIFCIMSKAKCIVIVGGREYSFNDGR